MTIRLLQQQVVLELAVGAEKRQGVLIASLILAGRGQCVKVPCLTDEVKGGVRQGDVFFQDGAMATPRGQSLTQHQGVVAQSEDGLKMLRFSHRHMLLTSSGSL